MTPLAFAAALTALMLASLSLAVAVDWAIKRTVELWQEGRE